MDSLIFDISPTRKSFSYQLRDQGFDLTRPESLSQLEIVCLIAVTINTCEALLRCLDSNGIKHNLTVD